MIDQGANGYALLVPPFYSAWVGGLFWFDVLLIGSVDGMVKGFGGISTIWLLLTQMVGHG
jgi:hypothetical protein